jgi:hypothetical protein
MNNAPPRHRPARRPDTRSDLRESPGKDVALVLENTLEDRVRRLRLLAARRRVSGRTPGHASKPAV